MTRKPYDTNTVTNDIAGTNNNNVNRSHRKEGNPGRSLQVILKRSGRKVITIDTFEPKRWRTGMESITACFWLNDGKTSTYIAGSGSAGGCGYHKESAAISAAVAASGIDMTNFGGAGDSTVLVAVGAIMRKLGYRKNQYIVSHR